MEVYQNAYEAMLIAHKEIIPKLPKEEDYDLKNQLRRSTNDMVSRKLYNLALAWDKFNIRGRKTNDDSSYATDNLTTRGNELQG